MKEQFCDYNTSKMLKELEFDEMCFASFDTDGKNLMTNNDGSMSKNSQINYGVYSPLWQQVNQWLWEEHKINIQVKGLSRFYTKINKLDSIIFESPSLFNLRFTSPITAEIEGIKAAVKHLHEKLKP